MCDYIVITRHEIICTCTCSDSDSNSRTVVITRQTWTSSVLQKESFTVKQCHVSMLHIKLKSGCQRSTAAAY